MNVRAAISFDLNLEVEPQTQAIPALIALGTRQGFLSDEDILQVFPGENMDDLEDIYTALEEAGIALADPEGTSENLEEDSKVENQLYEDRRSLDKEEENALFSSIEADDLVGLYFREAARNPLLSLEEEVNLAKRIERGLNARQNISKSRDLPSEHYQELQALITDSWMATDQLITANARLVISIAKKYAQRGLPFLDLIQEGNIGLMRAVKRFDYRRGYKFSTYATWWIRQAVSRALADQSRTIRLPVHRSDQLSRLFRLQHQLRQQLGREPTTAEVAEGLGVTAEIVHERFQEAQFPLSLDMPVSFSGDSGSADESVLGDFLEDEESPDPDEMTTMNLLREHFDQIFEFLPPREVQILKLRYGFADGQPRTLREIGLKIGVSRERIRQIEAQALHRLRQPEIQNKLRSYIHPI